MPASGTDTARRIYQNQWVGDRRRRSASDLLGAASDEQEMVCEGQIRFAIVQRAQIEKKIQLKCEAIKRRELFASA